jgi:hypothetical protein
VIFWVECSMNSDYFQIVDCQLFLNYSYYLSLYYCGYLRLAVDHFFLQAVLYCLNDTDNSFITGR